MATMSICQPSRRQKTTTARPHGVHRFTFFGLKFGFCILIYLVSLFAGGISRGGSVTVGWNPATDPAVVGYDVYYGLQSDTYTTVLVTGTNDILNVTGLTDGATYYFAVTAYDAAGNESLFSGEIAYTVPAPPTIAVEPLNETNAAGSVAVFGVTASGSAPLYYQWSLNGNAISAATNAILALSNIVDASAGTYSVVISNSVGMVTSSGATLTVIDPPVIVTGPSSLTNFALTPAVFGVTASGTAPFGYQWSRNGAVLSDGGGVSGSKTGTLTLLSAMPGDAGNYTVTVSNLAGSVSSGAVLTMIDNQVLNPAAAVAMSGQYNGLFYVTNSSGAPAITEATAGMFGNCVVATNRTYSARLTIGGAIYTMSGTLDLTGNDSRVVSRAMLSAPNVTVALHIDWTFGTRQITGTVSNMSSTYPWVATLVASQGTNALPVPPLSIRAYLPAAAGAPVSSPGGFGTIAFVTTVAGAATVTGVLADGTAVSQGVPVAKDGTIPLFANLYGGKGLLEGWVSLAGGVPAGTLTWLNTTTNARSLYPNGFTCTVPLQTIVP